jgi:hypothetical protein
MNLVHSKDVLGELRSALMIGLCMLLEDQDAPYSAFQHNQVFTGAISAIQNALSVLGRHSTRFQKK